MNQFFGDVRWALRSWGAGLWFVGIVVVLASASAAAYSNRHTVVIGGAIALFNVGFAGTQRVWYLRSFRGENFEGHEVWSLTRSFFGQFFRLGLLCFGPLAVALIIWIALEAHHQPHHTVDQMPIGLTLLLIGLWVILDIALTFVVPALAFSTTSAKQALSSGLHMIGQTWPSCAWYVLAPGITFSFGSLLISTHALGGWARPILIVVSSMVAFLFRGAVVPYYLRLHPEVARDGSANQLAISTAQATNPPAGWYPDPMGSAAARWWDGNAWTERID